MSFPTASPSAGNALDITYNFVDPATSANAGHVYGITNNLNTKRSQVFTYDQLDRITSVGTTDTTNAATCWGNKYTYDAWANLLSQATWTPTYNAWRVALDKRGGCVKRKLIPSGFATVVLAREAEEQDSGNLTQITFPWRLLSKIVPPTIDTA